MNKQKQDLINEAWQDYCFDVLKDQKLIDHGVPGAFEYGFIMGMDASISAVEKYKRALDSGSNRFINAAKREIEALG